MLNIISKTTEFDGEYYSEDSIIPLILEFSKNQKRKIIGT